MRKNDFCKLLARAAGISPNRADLLLTYTTDLICAVLEDEGELTLDGFGTFRAILLPNGALKRNDTGATMKVPPRYAVAFRPTLGLRKKASAWPLPTAVHEKDSL